MITSIIKIRGISKRVELNLAQKKELELENQVSESKSAETRFLFHALTVKHAVTLSVAFALFYCTIRTMPVALLPI